MFSFKTHPGAVTVTEGVQMAFDYLQATWRKWLPVVVVVAAFTFVFSALVGRIDFGSAVSVQTTTNRNVSNTYFFYNAGVSLPGIVVGWIFTAIAIAGLRNRPLTVAFVVGRGVIAFAAAALIGVVVFVAMIALFAFVVVAILASSVVGVLLLLALIVGVTPVAVYLAIRTSFYALAIFDGSGPIGGIQESWALSQGSVLRLFGWGLMAILIVVGFAIVGAIVSVPFLIAYSPAGQAVSNAFTTTGSCFVVFMMAVLYESQRARRDPSLYQFTPSPGYPAPYPGPYPYAPGPYAAGPSPYPAGPSPYGAGPYPPAPGPYSPGPYPGGPYPAGSAWPGAAAPYPGGPYPYGPGPNPGWINPNAPTWPGYPPAYPGTPPAWGANSSADPARKPGESGEVSSGPQPPLSAQGPTDPPAST